VDWWFASKERLGHELIAAGLLMLAGPTDLDELDKWLRVGWERGRGQHRSSASTELTLRSHEKALAFHPRNGYPMTLMLLTSSNGTVVLPPIWVS
jgi:hypothetical protein